MDPLKILSLGVVLSALSLFLPIYITTFREMGCGLVETVLIAIHNVIRLFVVDGEFNIVTETLGKSNAAEWVAGGYTVLFSILFVVAPAMTFGFVLSFFKNISAYISYYTHCRRAAFIFSQLNEKSLALAESLSKNDEKGRVLVFCDVDEKEDDCSFELVEKAKELGAICFQKDILAIRFASLKRKREISFFAIGEDESENIRQALKLIEQFKDRENTNLYIFSNQVESELLLSSAFHEEGESSAKIRVRRVNEVQSLVFRNLYQKGFEMIFESALADESEEKKINALVVGMGLHGTEMTKALSWFCQMTGYLPQINAFDLDEKAEEKFTSLCPELMAFSGKTSIKGENRYTIRIHSGVDVDTLSFDRLVSALPQTTYVFVALGNDEKNIATAVKLRSLFEQKGYFPKIQAVVESRDKKVALTDITNFKGQKYEIDFIGDTATSYSEEVILGSDVEEKALERHLKWGEERAFWQYSYNYRSSVASAIHRKMKEECGIPGVKKAPEKRTSDELWGLRILEHCRWNAYMRSEGYIYGGTTERSGRNDLAKMHNCLVPFDELPLAEQEKDDD